MGSVKLVRLDPVIERALQDDTEYTEALVQEDWGRLADATRRVLGHTPVSSSSSAEEPHWGGFLVVDAESQELVGSCAFKGPPTDQQAVEIAYFAYPGCEGRGYATAMARALIALATRSKAIRQVIAHTLPETNASTRVLEKVEMTRVGEVMDPQDGLVWRWQFEVRSS